jgi:small conductance mechanosensitive channel
MFGLKSKKLSIFEKVFGCVFLLLTLAYFVLLAFGKWIFPTNSVFYRSLNIFSGASDPNVFIRILSYSFFIFGSSFIVRLLLTLCLPLLKKTKGLLTILISVIKYAAVLLWLFFVLSSFGVNTTVILAGIGILSLIVGLAIQPLLADIIAGLFIVFEDVFHVGDVIVADGFRGQVKEIGMRHTQLVDAGGNVKVINNSDIRSMVNLTDQLSVVAIDMSIEYGESLERVEAIIAQNIDKIKEAIPAIVEGPFYKGVSALADSSVNLKFFAKCEEDDRFQVERDLNRQFKLLFDKNNINIPFPQVVVNKPVEFASATEKEKEIAHEFVNEQKETSSGIEENNNDVK